MARLATWVHVTDDRGTSQAFGPDDEVPAWAASKISNPAAWAEAPEIVSRLTETVSKPTAKKAAAKRTPRRKAVADDTVVHGG